MSPLSLPIFPSSDTWTSISLWILCPLGTVLALAYIYLEFYKDSQILYKNVPGTCYDKSSLNIANSR